MHDLGHNTQMTAPAGSVIVAPEAGVGLPPRGELERRDGGIRPQANAAWGVVDPAGLAGHLYRGTTNQKAKASQTSTGNYAGTGSAEGHSRVPEANQ